MFTHVVVAVSVTALVLTAAVLLSLRSLKSNVRGIHANVAAALGVAELLFLLGIHRTHNQVQGRGPGEPCLCDSAFFWKSWGLSSGSKLRDTEV